MPPRQLITEDFRPLIADLVDEGLTNAEIQAELSTHHNLQCSLRSLTRAQTDWGLQKLPDEHTYELVNDLISSYHGQGMRAKHLLNIIKECHGFTLSPRTLARRCQVLGLHQKHDDIDLGKVTMEEVAEFIRQTKRNPDGKLAGYRRVHHILRNQHDVFVHSCAPNYCYLAPNSNNGVEGLIPAPLEDVEELQAQHYPNAEELMVTSPLWLREICALAQEELQIDADNIDMENIWIVFHKILSFLRSYDLFLLGMPEGAPRAATNHEKAVETVANRFGLLPRNH
ncbi:uncharacterized protein MELLADRAFT_110939 [Melampsora larici-populina 98AG31]|uniref:Clr5 domain-containing protein n=1 Tax=Melampsora larici-populina (strain 98AG31 / pathotype 3-4-7) TaxID=747676 RepID=F4S1H8_MELLP|nr:uncharacterized protein MELLADRAFT_110939 [Melampsora larici-populina 98AG31]EGG01502.1 hypothetical protein MELLADRAFT_110939 [Melampsora larici-populina 98AG31]